MKLKRCKKCLKEKAISMFSFTIIYKGKQYISSYCKPCQNIYHKVWLKKHPGYNLLRMRKYFENPENEAKQRERDKIYQKKKRANNPKLKLDETRKYFEKYPARKKVREKVVNALRMGKLKKTPCVVCGEIKVHGHHPDYRKPLEVVWLCPSHHKKVDLGIINL